MNTPIFLPPFVRRLTAILGCLAVSLPALSRAQLYTESTTLHGDARNSDYFGYYLAASGDTLAISTGSNKNAYVFVRSGSTWTLQQEFPVGISVYSNGEIAMDGDTVVVGGEIFVRSGGTWTLQQSLGGTMPIPAVQGDTLAIGNLPIGQSSTPQDGTVTVYTRSGSTWTQQATLVPDSPGVTMGYGVVIDGDTLITGTTGQNQNCNGVYIFVRSGTTWTQQARLFPPTYGGWLRVALEGNTAVIADPNNGHLYIYNRAGTAWTLTDTINTPPQAGAYLGDRLALSGGLLAAWASGGYYLFSHTPAGWIVAQSIPRNYFFGSLALANRGKLFAVGNPFQSGGGNTNNGIAETFSVPPPPAPGSGWHDTDVGAVGMAGSSTANGTTVAVSGSGADIWDRSDQFHYRSQALTGDGAIIAHVDSAGSGNAWSKVGLMAREDVAPSARTVMALVTPGSHLGVQARVAESDTTSFQDAGWAGAPIWLMLARSGDLFAAYRSDDGNNWTPLGSATVSMPATIHVGLAVSSHDNATLNTGTFSAIELVGSEEPPPPPPPGAPNPPSNLTGNLASSTSVHLQWTDNSTDETGFVVERSPGTGGGAYATVTTTAANVVEYTDAGLPANTTFTYRLRAVNGGTTSAASNTFTITTGSAPAALVGSPLGATSVGGSFSVSGSVITMDAAGADIWNQADSGYFVNREVTGDFDLRAHIDSMTNTHPWAKIGVMVRESLDAGARNLFTLLTTGNIAGLQVRDTFGAATTFQSGPWINPPYWVRLTRTGNVFQAYLSPDGVTWQNVGSATLALPATLRAGVAMSSHVDGTSAHASVSGLTFN